MLYKCHYVNSTSPNADYVLSAPISALKLVKITHLAPSADFQLWQQPEGCENALRQTICFETGVTRRGHKYVRITGITSQDSQNIRAG